MTRPREIPRWAWNQAAAGADHHSKRQVHIARAVMRVRNEALEEAAKLCEEYGDTIAIAGEKGDYLPVSPTIAQAIRRLKTQAS